jgi:5'-nucleotidase
MALSNGSPTVLITNDDGVQAPGLLALYNALSAAGFRVVVCAPDRPRSASGHAITLHKPLRIKKVTLANGAEAFACSGTPADCSALGLLEVATPNMAGVEKVDCVVSGINHGPNLGWDVTYSGTVAAAIEATIYGYPAIAVSVASYADHLHYEPVAQFVARSLVPQVLEHGLPRATLINVNAPDVPGEEVRGVRVTVQGDRQYVDRLEKRLDPTGKPYYWLGGALHTVEAKPGTDTRAVGEGYISVTPIQLDLTHHVLLPDLANWKLNLG